MPELKEVTERARGSSSTRGAMSRQQARRVIKARLLAQTLAFAALTYAAMVLYYFGILPLSGLVA
jgi:hypothetical protein